VDGGAGALEIGTAYNNQGLTYLLTSYADTAGTQIVNQVEDACPGAAACFEAEARPESSGGFQHPCRHLD
jgi:hypothetical protein